MKDTSARAMLDETYKAEPPPTPEGRSAISQPPSPHLVTIDGDMIREVSRVQHDKTLQSVRDLIDEIPKSKRRVNARWDTDTEPRTAAEVLGDLRAGLIKLREQR